MTSNHAELIDRAFQAASSGGDPANGAEAFFDSLGMMRGTYAPAARAGFGFAVGWGGMQALKPSFAYERNGNPRPWAVTNPRDPRATSVPWFAIPGALAIISGVFI